MQGHQAPRILDGAAHLSFPQSLFFSYSDRLLFKQSK